MNNHPIDFISKLRLMNCRNGVYIGMPVNYALHVTSTTPDSVKGGKDFTTKSGLTIRRSKVKYKSRFVFVLEDGTTWQYKQLALADINGKDYLV